LYKTCKLSFIHSFINRKQVKVKVNNPQVHVHVRITHIAG